VAAGGGGAASSRKKKKKKGKTKQAPGGGSGGGPSLEQVPPLRKDAAAPSSSAADADLKPYHRLLKLIEREASLKVQGSPHHDPAELEMLEMEASATVQSFKWICGIPSLYLPCTFPVPSLYLPCTFSQVDLRHTGAASIRHRERTDVGRE
jgi:hypothetical protein